MADSSTLSVLVRSMARDVDERREAVGLLLYLSDLPAVRRRVGRIQGCIVMLVAILNGEDSKASNDAAKMLNALSGSTQNALHMAEAGYFKPLVQYLKEGQLLPLLPDLYCAFYTSFFIECNSYGFHKPSK